MSATVDMESNALRIIDAALNRAGEGLRVVEDYTRFQLDDPFLTQLAKTLRHELADAAALVPAADRHAWRDTLADVGAAISTDAEARRRDPWDVCSAGLKRVQQALRSLEEYGKLVDIELARRCEALRYRMYTMEKAIDVGTLSRKRFESVRLCVLIDARDSTEEFELLVRKLVEAGVGMIQLREKHVNDRELVQRARQLRQLTRGTSTLAIINDRADIAAIAHADGVHVGQDDLSVKDARTIVGPRALIGVSTHNIAQARAAVLDGANYLGAGPTFPSETKSFDHFAGLEYLREVAAEIRLPTFAIGGINASNLPDVLATGVSRMAVRAAVTEAAEPDLAALRLVRLLENVKTEAALPSLTPEP